jgi:alpha-1,6-mannosyltransferase
MKIVDVCAFYAPKGGGVRTYVEQKLALAPALGHEIVVLAPGKENRTEKRGDGARIEWLAGPRLPLDPRYRYFPDKGVVLRALDAERPDLIEASSPWRSAAAVAEWPGDAPRALVMHADPLAAFAYRWFEAIATPERVDQQLDWYWRRLRRLAHAFDATISASSGLTRRLDEKGIPRLFTNPMGVSGQTFSPALRSEELRNRLLERCMLSTDATLLLAVGRHASEKRWPMVIEAVQAVGFEHPVGLVLIGDGRDRARIVRKIDGNPHIHLLSPIANRIELARIMASADALIHGCDAETFSLVAAEARASGLTLIAPNRGGAADQAMASGGHLYEAGSAADAARAIAEFIRSGVTDRPLRVRTIAEHFSQLFGLYEGLAGRRHLPS